jgi:hypothetical protein
LYDRVPYDQAEEQPDTPFHGLLGHREHTMAGELPQQFVLRVSGDQGFVETGVIQNGNNASVQCIVFRLSADPLVLELEEDPCCSSHSYQEGKGDDRLDHEPFRVTGDSLHSPTLTRKMSSDDCRGFSKSHQLSAISYQPITPGGRGS